MSPLAFVSKSQPQKPTKGWRCCSRCLLSVLSYYPSPDISGHQYPGFLWKICPSLFSVQRTWMGLTLTLNPLSRNGYMTQTWTIRSSKPFAIVIRPGIRAWANSGKWGSIMRILLAQLGKRSFLSMKTISYKNVGCFHLLESMKKVPWKWSQHNNAELRHTKRWRLNWMALLSPYMPLKPDIPELLIYISW